MSAVIIDLEKAKSEKTPSLKPPRAWWDKHYAEVKAGNPNYTDEQISATVGKIWSDMGAGQKKARREKEGKKYGKAPTSKSFFTFGKSEEEYKAVAHPEGHMEPTCIVDVFENDKFTGQEVCTIPMVLEEPENYDNRTFWILIECLSQTYMGTEKLRAELTQRLVEELIENIDAEEQERKEREEAAAAGKTADVKQPESNWEKKEHHLLGKDMFELDLIPTAKEDEWLQKAALTTAKRKKIKPKQPLVPEKKGDCPHCHKSLDEPPVTPTEEKPKDNETPKP